MDKFKKFLVPIMVIARLIPIGQIIAILETWVTAVAIYYLYSIVLRWIKAIE